MKRFAITLVVVLVHFFSTAPVAAQTDPWDRHITLPGIEMLVAARSSNVSLTLSDPYFGGQVSVEIQGWVSRPTSLAHPRHIECPEGYRWVETEDGGPIICYRAFRQGAWLLKDEETGAMVLLPGLKLPSPWLLLA